MQWMHVIPDVWLHDLAMSLVGFQPGGKRAECREDVASERQTFEPLRLFVSHSAQSFRPSLAGARSARCKIEQTLIQLFFIHVRSKVPCTKARLLGPGATSSSSWSRCQIAISSPRLSALTAFTCTYCGWPVLLRTSSLNPSHLKNNASAMPQLNTRNAMLMMPLSRTLIRKTESVENAT